MSKNDRVQVWMSENLKRQLYSWAQTRGMNMSEAVRYIIRQKLDTD